MEQTSVVAEVNEQYLQLVEVQSVSPQTPVVKSALFASSQTEHFEISVPLATIQSSAVSLTQAFPDK